MLLTYFNITLQYYNNTNIPILTTLKVKFNPAVTRFCIEELERFVLIPWLNTFSQFSHS